MHVPQCIVIILYMYSMITMIHHCGTLLLMLNLSTSILHVHSGRGSEDLHVCVGASLV